MIKNFFVLVLTFLSTALIANENLTETIKLEKHYKVENTFSGDLYENTSFHFIFAKNKKTKEKEILGYLYNGAQVEKLENISSKKELSIISFHSTTSHLTVLFSYKEKKNEFLKRVVYDLSTKKITENESSSNEDMEASFRTKNKSVLIFKNDDKLFFKSFTEDKKAKESSYTFKDDKDPIKIFFEDNHISTIKTDEFVANGSTSELKAYLENDKIIFTKEDEKQNKCSVLALSLSEETIIPQPILNFTNTSPNKKFKKTVSYYSNGKLFLVSLSKKMGGLKIFDIAKNQELNSIAFDQNLVSQLKTSTAFDGIEKFLKNAGKNKYNPTVTVNKTTSDKLVIRMDYVDVNYGYKYNWWWHHQQFFMWQQQFYMQQMQMNMPSGFGPSQPEYFFPSITKDEKHYFELLIDLNGKLLNEELPRTMYNEVDKKQFVDTLEKIKSIKHESSCFLKDSFRYIGYSKKLKSFIFQTNKI
ncbi:hypothetical protein [Tenacibaculum sp. 190524A05c]|uniref:hypothetical protein n=1 Tax=Tenacibaculum platacis TaxID=3137852 RepID=UPI0032B2A2A6